MGDMELIGWIPLDADGTPKRPNRSGYAWQKDLTSPPRIYTTEARAKAQSPVGLAKAVFMERH